MKQLLIGLLALGSISAFAAIEVKTANENIVKLNVTATGADGLESCNSEVLRLVSRLEKTNRVILRNSQVCSEEYRYEVKDGTVARYNGFVEYLKY